MPQPREPKRRPKRGTNLRMVIDAQQAEMLAGMRALTDAVRSLTETAARLEQQIARSTERFATMRRG